MPSRSSGDTTEHSLSASHATERSSPLFLAWLLPQTDGPVLPLSELSGELDIGRDEHCAASLAGQEVSRRHALVRAQGPHRVLTDLESRNGTWVNGRRVRSVVLACGDVVRVGGWVGVVSRYAGPFGALAPGLFGGEALRRALGAAESAARSDLPIVLEGETGTGKEAVAKAIHAWSGRTGPFAAVNCAALPEALAEGELFGYRRGAFSGADQASPGHFRAAQHGTLLLDEICELTLPLQAKLLRVLEEREVQPLGEARPIKLNVRVLTAAQRSLAEAVARGEFRADLYARLDGLTLKLPPLRQRKAEVPYLFARMLLSGSGARPPAVDPRVVERLCLYDWPFNVRELALVVKRLLVLHGTEPKLKLRHLPERFLGGAGDSAEVQPAEVAPAADDARSAPFADPPDLPRLLAALRESGGNVARAAQALGISRQRAYRLMQAHPEVSLAMLRDGAES
jgi:transcriptional regulator of acetoin/glycerol metabolism